MLTGKAVVTVVEKNLIEKMHIFSDYSKARNEFKEICHEYYTGDNFHGEWPNFLNNMNMEFSGGAVQLTVTV